MYSTHGKQGKVVVQRSNGSGLVASFVVILLPMVHHCDYFLFCRITVLISPSAEMMVKAAAAATATKIIKNSNAEKTVNKFGLICRETRVEQEIL